MGMGDAAVRFAPLVGAWPGEPTPATQRRKPPFRETTTVTASLERLAHELGMLGVREALVRVDVDVTAIGARGGLLRHPPTPGVVLDFEHPARGGRPAAPALMGFDAYATWQANVRAAALTLEALRAVDRHRGDAVRGEQYTGFLRLPGAGGVNTTAVVLTPERAARLLVDAHPSARGRTPMDRELFAHVLIATGTNVAHALQFADEARVAAHPDRGGSAAAFTTVTEARRVVYRHHGREAR
jgi:hypothetical protein